MGWEQPPPVPYCYLQHPPLRYQHLAHRIKYAKYLRFAFLSAISLPYLQLLKLGLRLLVAAVLVRMILQGQCLVLRLNLLRLKEEEEGEELDVN